MSSSGSRDLTAHICLVQRLGRRVGRLTAEEMWSVDEALFVVLGLD
jgi:mRNA-degrading endonuclease toxin of MazEF toxin-antitoxin module